MKSLKKWLTEKIKRKNPIYKSGMPKFSEKLKTALVSGKGASCIENIHLIGSLRIDVREYAYYSCRLTVTLCGRDGEELIKFPSKTVGYGESLTLEGVNIGLPVELRDG